MHVTKGVKQATCPACENATCDKLGRHGGQAVPDGSTALSGKPTDCAPINTFATMIYNVNSIPHQIFAAKLDTLSPPIAHSNDLACHAKLYCFAQMYMADPLKDICTHMLHRDLMHFEITTDTIGAVVELVSFTYDNTVFDTGMLSGGSELRDLVLRFVIARKSRLAQFHEFDELLVAGGDFVVDLFRGELMMPF
ncbi:uncharacterized protein HMPREF1541_10273 [Cyphellophora europaea CBS 101466]|uniref:BTB domain-containing protein n=1 Tax=Cyphellophora europaea (strain CBS 101466) TaxID=1220924 RepID=W2S995_CYPE1|nr:uncharacterized protein HMPREF1541_10273 [Cyphellophora europaea CBS 101466]ETN44603.1 hypothetical protein HMPREF1541_10273 [Cyphellophora europaea CBS 101466]